MNQQQNPIVPQSNAQVQPNTIQQPNGQKPGNKKMMADDEESEWSLSSLQELKGLDLNQMKDDEQREPTVRQKQTENANKPVAKYPPLQQITPDTNIFQVGKITQKVGELLIVEANNCMNLVDLDNWLFSESKQCFGFVMDIFGKVQQPYYAIKLLGEVQQKIMNWDSMLGLPLFYAEGCKTLTEQDIKSIKQKSAMNKQDFMESSSSQEQYEDFQQMRSNQLPRNTSYKPQRKASFEEQPYNRDRTREKRHHRPQHQANFEDHRPARQQFDPRSMMQDRQQNQMYLENMYNMYYSQMMQLYNGGQNGMPLPRPPVFPPFQQPPQ